MTTSKQQIEAIWDDGFNIFYPLGPSDPMLCAVYFQPVEGEYWDHSGLKSAKYVFRALKAAILDQPLKLEEPEEHGRVQL